MLENSIALLSQPKLVIFDLDGTLVDSVPEIALALDDTLRELGLMPAGQDKTKGWVGNGLKTLLSRALSDQSSSLDANPDAWYILLDAYERHINQQPSLFAGSKALLEGLQSQGVKIALATNKAQKFVPSILEAQGILAYFDCVIGGDTLDEKKPHPKPLLHICETLSVAPSETWMIGDSPVDAHCAEAAGITCILLEQGYNQGISLHSLPNHCVLPDMKSLSELYIHR